MKGTYVDGKEDGIFITYYESGREKKKTRFVMGEVLKK
jgi:antitoxin component YwqK of YwqJK toxin-antitoxin module